MSPCGSEENKGTHRFNSNLNRILWEAAEKKIQLASPETRQLIQTRLADFVSAYPQQRSLKYRDKQKTKPKSLTYENFGEFLCAADISYREMLEIISAEEENHGVVSWSSKEQFEMCQILDDLSPKQRKHAYSIVYQFVADDFKTLCDENDPILGRRTCIALSYKYNDNSASIKLFKDLGLGIKWQKSKSSNPSISFWAVPFEKIPVIASRTGLSPHWMLGLDGDQVVLAKHGDTELIMDWFCLLSDSFQSLLCKSFQTVYLSGGFENGK